MKSLRAHRRFISVLMITLMLSWQIGQPLRAATFIWNQAGAGTYSWITDGNWTTSGFPNAVGDVANLTNDISGDLTINLNRVLTLGALNIGDASGTTNFFTLAAGTGGYLIMDDTDGAVDITKAAGGPDVISTGIQFNDNLTISNDSAGTLTLSGALRSLNSSLTLEGTGAGVTTISGVISTAGNLVKNESGIFTLSGANTYAGTTTVNAGTLRLNGTTALPVRSAVTVASGAVLDVQQALTMGSLAGAGDFTNSSGTNRIITIGRDDTSTIFSGRINPGTASRVAITKIGAGTLTLQPTGTNASTYTGNTIVNGGKIALDTSASTLTTGFLGATPLQITGGNFEMIGRGSATVSQTVGALTLGATGGAITLTPNGGTSTSLTTGAVTASASGGALLVAAPTGTTFKVGTAIASTALNGRLVFTDGTANTYNWAYNNNATGTAVSGFVSSTTLLTSGGATGTSYILSTGQAQTGDTTIGTLKLTGTGTQTLDLSTFTMQLGGGTTSTPGAILIDGTAAWNINGSGFLTANTPGTSPDLIFQHYGTGTVTVNASIGAAGATALVKAGTGTLVIAGTNNFTGAVFVDGGVLSFSSVTAGAAGSLGSGATNAVTIRDGATLRYTGATGTIIATSTTAGAHTYVLQGGNATIDITDSAANLTLNGVISGAGGLTKIGPGTLTLASQGGTGTATNSTYTGPTFVNAGTLSISGADRIPDLSPVTVASGATLNISAGNDTIGSIAGVGVISAGTTARTLTVGGDNTSTTFSGTLTGAAAHVFSKGGVGTLTIALGATTAWTGNSAVNSGVLRLNNANGLPSTGAWTTGNSAQPAMLDFNGFNASVGGLSFYGSSSATTSQGTVNLGSGNATVTGTSTVNNNNNPMAALITGTGSLVMTAARIFDVRDSTSVLSTEAELVISANFSGANGGITKAGGGNLKITGTNTMTGATANTFNSGITWLDYTTNNTDKINDTGALAFGGGTVILTGNNSAGTAQAVAGLTLTSGSSVLTLNPGTGQDLALNLGAITRATSGGAMRFNLPTGTQSGTNGFLTTQANVNGILGGFATATDGSGTGFATNSGGNIVVFTSTTADDVSLWTAGADITDSSGFTGTLGSSISINTLRFNAAGPSTVTIGSGNTLEVASGGILQTSSVTGGISLITGGTLSSGTGDELIFTIDSATQRLEVASALTGPTIVTKAGNGTLRLSGVNTNTGVINLYGGTLQVDGGSAFGDSTALTLSTNNSTVFEVLASEAIGSLATGGVNTGGLASEIRLTSGTTLTINQAVAGTYSGAISGTGTLLKSGSATLTYGTASTSVVTGNTFTGTIQINAGTLLLNGNVIQFPNVTAVVLSGPTSVLQLNNDQTTAVGNRINSAANVTLRNTAGGLGLYMSRNAGTTTGTQNFNQLILDAGHNTLTADGTAASRIGTLKFNAGTPLVRNNFATALLLGRSLGTGTQRGSIVFTSDPGGAVGGGGAAGTTTINIYPYFVGESTAAAPTAANYGNTFVMLNDTATLGMRPLDLATEYVVDQAGANGYDLLLGAGVVTNNMRFTTTTTTLAADTTGVNSLVLDSASGVTVNGPAQAFEITSGAILSAGVGANAIAGFTGLTTASSRPYYVYVTDPAGSLTLTSPVTSAVQLVKSGAGTLILSSGSSTITDLYLNQGTTQVAAVANLGSGTGGLNFFGGTLQYTGSGSESLSVKTASIGTGDAIIDISNAAGVLALTNGVGFTAAAGTLTKIGAGTLALDGANTYTGATFVNAGRFNVNGSAVSAITVNGGTGTQGTLGGTGTITGGITLATNGATSFAQGAVLNPGTVGGAGTLTINTLALTSNSFSNLNYDLDTALTVGGGVNDLITTNVLPIFSGNTLLNVNALNPLSAGLYTLINGYSGTIDTTNITLGSITGDATKSLALLVNNAGSLQVFVAAATPITAYWSGAVDANWNYLDMGTAATNWRTSAAGNVDTNALPGAVTDVFFYTTTPAAGNLSTTLGQNFLIKSLTFTADSTSAVSITGNTLTLAPSSSATGLTMNAAAGAVTINSDVALGSDQTWTNDSVTNGLTVNGDISGGFSLTKAGLGTITLTGTSAYSGGTILSTGILVAGSSQALGLAANTLTLSGGILDLASDASTTAHNTTVTSNVTINSNLATAGAGITHTLGTLTIGAQTLNITKGANVTSGTAGLSFGATDIGTGGVVFNAATGTLLTISGIISGGPGNSTQASPGGNIAITIQGGGSVAFGNAGNTFTGDILVDGGTFVVDNVRDWGSTTTASTDSHTIILNNGGTLSVTASVNPGATTTTSYDLVKVDTNGGTIDTASGATLTLDDVGQLYGSGDLSKTGNGTLVLRNQTTLFTGAIDITAGLLQMSGTSGGFGSNTAGTTIQSGAALNLNGQGVTDTETLTIYGTGLAANPAGVITNSSGTSASFAGAVVLGSNATIGSAAGGTITLSGGITGAYDLTIKNLAAGGTTLSTTTVNNTGTITNVSTGTGGLTISSVIGANVTGVTQNSTSSALTLSGNNASFTGGVTILKGTVNATTSAGALGTGTVTLGSASASSSPAQLNVGTNSLTFSNPIVLADRSTQTGALTLGIVVTTVGTTYSGGVTGNNDLVLYQDTTGSSGRIAFTTNPVNISGTVTVNGANTFGQTAAASISGGVGSNVTSLIVNNNFAGLTVATTALTVNGGGTTLVNNATGGTVLLTVSGGVNGTGNLILNNNSGIANGITLSTTSVDNTGTITNSGSGAGVTLISAVLGANVTGVVQESATSQLTLSGSNASYVAGLTINAGTLSAATSLNALGSTSNTINLGATSGSADATLNYGLTGTWVATPINVRAGSAGTLTIKSSTDTPNVAGAITLNNNLTLSIASAITFSGGITGTGNVTIAGTGAKTLTISTIALGFTGNLTNNFTGTGAGTVTISAPVNITGAITNNSAGSAAMTISGVIGSSVTGIVQNSTTSGLTLSGNNSSFAGPISIKAGTLTANLTGVATTLGDGSATNTITIGDSSGSNNATLSGVNNVTYLQNIIIASGNTGIARINAGTTTGSTIYAGTITLNSHDVVLGKVGTTGSSQFTGGITGTGNVTILNEATTGTITLATGAVNPVGSIIHTSTASGATTISAAIGSNVTGVSQNSATSALTLSNQSIAFTGPLTISAGTLNMTGGATTGPTVTALSVAGGATLNLFNGAGQHFDLGTGALSLGVGSSTTTLGLELGSTSAYDHFTTSAAATTGNNVVLNLLGITGFTAGDYDLITAGSGLSGATYSIGGVAGTLGGYSLGFTTSDTLVRLTSTVNNGTYFWNGGVSTSWTGISGTSSNFTNDLAGTVNANGVPGVNNSVIFGASTQTGTSLSTTLDGPFSIKDLTFNNAVGTGPLTSISIAPGLAGTLTITPASSSTGINVQTGAPAAITISAPVILGNNQTWTVADAATNLTVSGAITGTANLVKSGSGIVTLSSAGNTYNGTTTVDSGVLQAGIANGFNAASAFTISAGATLRLNNFSATIGSLAGAGTVENAGAANSRTLTVGGDNTSTVFSGVLQDGGAFNLGLTKTGTGALTLSGLGNVNTGSITVSAGTLNLTGAWTGNTTTSTLVYGGSAANTIVNVSGDITAFSTTGGNANGAVAVYNQTVGTVDISPGTGNSQYVARAAGSYGYFNLTGGTYKNRSRWDTNGANNLGSALNTATASVGVVYIGGTGYLDHTNAEWFINGYSMGQITVATGGSINHTGSSAPFAIFMDSTTSGGTYGVLNLTGGTVTTGTQPVRFGNSTTNGSGNTGFINLAAGTLNVSSAISSSVNAAGGNNAYLAFVGGTLQTGAAITAWIPASTAGITYSSVLYGSVNNSAATGDNSQNFAGGLTFDSNGFNSSLSNVLAGATGVGVTQADLTVTGGSGYIGAPAVVFSTAGLVTGGTPAAGYALVSGGAVTGIVITNPGTYTSGTTPTITLMGGGGTGASVVSGSLTTANVSGGLTKIGAGTLTLSGANTYTGGTTVNEGTLALGANNVLADTGAVTVNGGIFDVATFNDTVGTVTLQNGSITGTSGVLTSTAAYELQSGSVSAILSGSVGVNKSTAGTVTLSGANTFTGVVNVTGGTLAFSTSASLGDASATNTLTGNGGTFSYTGPGALDLTTNRVFTVGSSGATLEATQSTGVLTISGGISGSSTGNLTKTGPGAVVIGNTTSLNSGAGSVTVSDGKLTASFGTGGISALSVGATGNMSFQNGSAEALALTGALNLANGSRLGFDLGAPGTPGTSDQINSAIAAVVSGTITLDFIGLSGFGAGTYNLISALSGLSGATYTLGSAPSGFNYSINVLDTLVSLDLVAFQPRYWTNSQSDGSWSTLTGDPFSNFSTDPAGSSNSGDIPGAAHTVIFSAASATGGTIATTLDGNFTIDSLQFINATTPATTSVTIAEGISGSTLTLAPSSTVGGIEIQDSAGAITISAALVVGLTGGAPSQTWSVSNTGASLLVSGAITFNDRVNKTGAGVLTLNGGNSGAGGITLTGGALNIGSATALGTGTLIIGAGTTIDNSFGSALTLSTNNALTWNGSFTFTGTQSLDFGTGNVALNGSTTVTTTANTLTVGGNLSDGAGTFSLSKNGAGTLIINGTANEVSGTLTVDAGTFTMNNGSSTLGALSAVAGTVGLSTNLTIAGAVSVSGAAVTANGTNTLGAGVSVTSGSLVLGGANTITGTLLNNGGTVTLGGANTVSAGVTNTSGTLNINHNNALSSQTFTINGGTIDNTSGSSVVNAGNNVQAWNNSFTFTGANALDLGTGAVTLGNSLSVTVSASTLTVGGVIDDGADTFNFTKLGTGTLILNGASTYGGVTTITTGTVIAGVDDALPTTTALSVGTGTTAATLNLQTFSQTVASLSSTANTASVSSIVIGSGETLTVNGSVSLNNNTDNAQTFLTMSGGGALVVNGTTFTVGNNTTGTNNSSRATLNLAALGSVNLTVSGTLAVMLTGDNNTAHVSTLVLSNTANTLTAGTLSVGPSATGGTQVLTLGNGTNVINANTINIGTGTRDFGTVSFASAAGSVVIRNTAGTGRAAFNMGTGGQNTGTAGGGLNTFNVNGHGADLLFSTLTIGGTNRNTTHTNTFSFDTGTLDATTVVVGDTNGTANTTAADTTWTSNLNLGGGTVIIGTGGLEIARGDTAVTGTDTLVGNVSISGGTVTIANNTTFGAAVRLAENSIATGLTTTGTLSITGGTVTVAGHIIKGVSTGAGSATLTLNGGILDMSSKNIGGSGAATVTFNAQSGTLRNLAQLNNGGTLDKTTTGTLILDTANAYTGLTTVSAGVLAISNGGALGGTTNGTSVAAGGTLDVSGGITVTGEALSLTAGATTDAILNSSSGSNTWTANLTVDTGSSTNSGRARVLSSAGSNLLISGNVNLSAGTADFVIGGDGNGEISGQITGSQRLFKSSSGTGTWILSGNNSSTFTGKTSISNGAIQISSEANLGATPGTFASNQLTLGGGSTNGTLKTTATMSLSANRGVTLNAGGGTFETNASTTLTVNSVITGSSTITKEGEGTLVFTAVNTNTGATTVNAGTLQVGVSGSGSTDVLSTVTLNGGSAVLAGSGTVNGSVVVTSGQINPGDDAGAAIGTLTIGGDATLTGGVSPSTHLTLQLAATSASDINDAAGIQAAQAGGTLAAYLTSKAADYELESGSHDKLVITGTLNLNSGGQISLDNTLNYNWVFGDVFDLLDWGSINLDFDGAGSLGAFDSASDLLLPSLGSGLSFDTSLFSTNGIIVVVPEPSRALLLLLGLLGLMCRRRR